MRFILICFLAGVFNTACVDDVDNVENRFPQQWQLVRMVSESDGFVKSGPQMDYQEFFLLKDDGTFLKSRLENGVKTSVQGTFSFVEGEDGDILQLVYDEASEIIGSCDAELVETFVVLGTNLLISDWPVCDGFGSEYRRFQ